MYNRPYKYLSEHSCLFEKQFDFQVAHSADHAVIQLVSQILQAFNKNQHTIVILIDLSKQCDTLDHHILLQKLQFFGIENSNFKWFQSCSMPKGSILGLLLFFMFVNDRRKSTELLVPVMFAGNANLFYFNKNSNIFEVANEELNQVIMVQSKQSFHK